MSYLNLEYYLKSGFYRFYFFKKLNTQSLTSQNQKHLEHNGIYVNEGLKIGKGRGTKSQIGDVGNLFWRRKSATLAAKELNGVNR